MAVARPSAPPRAWLQWAQPPTRLSRSLPRRWRGRSRGRRSCSCPCTPAGASVGSTEVFLVGDTSACGDRDGPRSFLPPPVRARGGPVGEHLVEPPQHQDVDPRGLAPFKCRRHIDALRLETGMRVSGQSLAANHPPALGAISTHKALDGTRSLKNASASVSTSRRVSRRRCASRPCRGKRNSSGVMRPEAGVEDLLEHAGADDPLPARDEDQAVQRPDDRRPL